MIREGGIKKKKVRNRVLNRENRGGGWSSKTKWRIMEIGFIGEIKLKSNYESQTGPY